MNLVRQCSFLTLLLCIESKKHNSSLLNPVHSKTHTHILSESKCDIGVSNLFNLYKYMPFRWRCDWSFEKIPYVFDFYSPSIKRLIGWVRKGLKYLEDRSCLLFEEKNPLKVGRKNNYTFIFYTYSGVPDDCCLPYFTKPVGRRLVLINPMCTMAPQIAHITLHALGLFHSPNESFPEDIVKAILFHVKCNNWNKKYEQFVFSRGWNNSENNHGNNKYNYENLTKLTEDTDNYGDEFIDINKK